MGNISLLALMMKLNHLTSLQQTNANPTFITAGPALLVAKNMISSDENLEPANIIIDVIQVSHHHTLVVHHVVQHGQPIAQLCPGLVELSQGSRFRQGTSCQSLT